MGFYKFIKIRGKDGARTGYYVPRMYRLHFSLTILRVFGLSYVRERLCGWTIWWVDSEENYNQAIKSLNELKKTRMFEYVVSE